jgi:hypothetical protein
MGCPLGVLLYGSPGTSIDFDDRALTHLQIVIAAKLRRGESFLFSWVTSASQGSGRCSVWLAPSIPLFYRFLGNRVPRVNPSWVHVLSLSANSGGGLVFSPEPSQSTQPSDLPRPEGQPAVRPHLPKEEGFSAR